MEVFDLSFNNISDMKIFENYTNLVNLNLSNNKIVEIDGVINLKYLKVLFYKKILNLNYNEIENIDNLENMGLIKLNL